MTVGMRHHQCRRVNTPSDSDGPRPSKHFISMLPRTSFHATLPLSSCSRFRCRPPPQSPDTQESIPPLSALALGAGKPPLPSSGQVDSTVVNRVMSGPGAVVTAKPFSHAAASGLSTYRRAK
ncbi:hypothetical protein EJ03DRAFT_322819 [Teratosphaeria nubilosa]|uniref:Uncharacterized protein n=1 Tax=Teratosphaeria nubilosa TaxID=161662 RepID=A0A6G1LN43_9PEZI|nr:hypothetical protein EJ03DRAFT_322819 [Teratosphaeria nubilosa]